MKNKKGLKRTKVLFITMISLFLLGTSFITLGYYFDVNYVGFRKNEMNICKFNVSFKDDNSITIKNTRPMSDSEGKNIEPYTFYINSNQNTCDNLQYKINMYNACETCTLVDGKCIISEDVVCDCSKEMQISEDAINYELKNTVTGDVLIGTNPYKINVIKTLVGNAKDTYEMKLWINEQATNEDLYLYENGKEVLNEDGSIKTKNICLKVVVGKSY